LCEPLTALEMYQSNTGYTSPTQVISLISFTAKPFITFIAFKWIPPQF